VTPSVLIDSFRQFINTPFAVGSTVTLIAAAVLACRSAHNPGAPIAWQWSVSLALAGGIGIFWSPWFGVASTIALLSVSFLNAPKQSSMSRLGFDMPRHLSWFEELSTELIAGMGQYLVFRLQRNEPHRVLRSASYWQHLDTFVPIRASRAVAFTPAETLAKEMASKSTGSNPCPVEVQIIADRQGITNYMRRLDVSEKIALLNAAHPMHPGGGVQFGCSAQEEVLCYNSNLALSIDPLYNPQVIDELSKNGCLGRNPQWFAEGGHRGNKIHGERPYGFSYLQFLVQTQQVQFDAKYIAVFEAYKKAYDRCEGSPNLKARLGIEATSPDEFKEAVHALYDLQRQHPTLPIVMGRSFYYLGEGGVLSGPGVWKSEGGKRDVFFISSAAPDFREMGDKSFIDGIGRANAHNDELVKNVIRNATACALERASNAGCQRIVLTALGTNVFLGNRRDLTDPYAPYADGMIEAISIMRTARANLPKIDFLFLGTSDRNCHDRFKSALKNARLISES